MRYATEEAAEGVVVGRAAHVARVVKDLSHRSQTIRGVPLHAPRCVLTTDPIVEAATEQTPIRDVACTIEIENRVEVLGADGSWLRRVPAIDDELLHR